MDEIIYANQSYTGYTKEHHQTKLYLRTFQNPFWYSSKCIQKALPEESYNYHQSNYSIVLLPSFQFTSGLQHVMIQQYSNRRLEVIVGFQFQVLPSPFLPLHFAAK